MPAAFVDLVAGDAPSTVFSPWSDVCSIYDVSKDAPERLRSNLRAYLGARDPVVVLVGGATGYQGCRYSGVPFSDEGRMYEEGGRRDWR